MNIYVGNLSLNVTEDQLRLVVHDSDRHHFSENREFSYIGSGQPRGYGFVEMASKSRAQAAITSLKGRKLRELVIDVVEALSLSDKRGIGLSKTEAAGLIEKGDKEDTKSVESLPNIKCNFTKEF